VAVQPDWMTMDACKGLRNSLRQLQDRTVDWMTIDACKGLRNSLRQLQDG
jgi:hypothetical protein